MGLQLGRGADGPVGLVDQDHLLGGIVHLRAFSRAHPERSSGHG
jgi:hypothetical protein